MRKLRSTTIAAGVLSIAVLAAGCAGNAINPQRAEVAIRDDVQIKTDTMVESVHCPNDVEVVPGDRFTCVVIAGDSSEAEAELEILNDDADVRLLGLTKR